MCVWRVRVRVRERTPHAYTRIIFNRSIDSIWPPGHECVGGRGGKGGKKGGGGRGGGLEFLM